MMDAHDAGEAPPSAPRFDGRDDFEFSAAVNGGNEQSHDHRQGPTVHQLCHTFLDNLKLRFGEESPEVTTVHDILAKRFGVGQMAKRDAIREVREILGDQQDLKQDLMKVLMHGEASWAPDDFDFDQSVVQTSPQLLLPDHQPRIRLPPISPSWYTDPQTHQSVSPAMLGGYGEHHGFGQSVSPSTHQIPTHFYSPTTFTSPIATESPTYEPHTGAIYEAERSPVSQQFDHAPSLDHMRIQWERDNDDDVAQVHRSRPWSPVQSDSLLGRTRSFASDHVQSPALPLEAYTPHAASPKEEEFVTTGPSILGTPVAVPLGQPTYSDEMPPPSRKRRRLNSSTHFKTEDDTYEDDAPTSARASPPAKVPGKRTMQRQAKKKAEEEQLQPAVGGLYIHSICGKGFGSRSKVKKHHWGAKLDDVDTTNGCWAKYDKPDVSWYETPLYVLHVEHTLTSYTNIRNEHPSCREGAPPPRTAKKPTKPRFKQGPKQQAPVVPTMIPTLEDLPRDVYEAINPHEVDQYGLQDIVPFHSHRLPTQDKFDSLLTAAAVAYRIEAPRPQGRNDSLISHLDAQAVAAEKNRQFCTSWSQGQQEEFAYGHHHPYTAHGLGISYPNGGVHVPLEVALPLQRDNYFHTPSSGPPQDANWDQDPLYQVNDVRLYRTSHEPDFPPYSEQMRRQI